MNNDEYDVKPLIALHLEIKHSSITGQWDSKSRGMWQDELMQKYGSMTPKYEVRIKGRKKALGYLFCDNFDKAWSIAKYCIDKKRYVYISTRKWDPILQSTEEGSRAPENMYIVAWGVKSVLRPKIEVEFTIKPEFKGWESGEQYNI